MHMQTVQTQITLPCRWSLIEVYIICHSTKSFKKLHKKQNFFKNKNMD